MTGVDQAVGASAAGGAELEDGFQYVTDETPAGITVLYSWQPKRLYRLRKGDGAWTEVPSVTQVLAVIDKSGPLMWWAQGVAINGSLELIRRNVIGFGKEGGLFERVDGYEDFEWKPCDVDRVVKLLSQHRLSVNHVRDAAGDRGVSVHDALETWAVKGILPTPDVFPEHERGYVQGVLLFLRDLEQAAPLATPPETEVMVGSLEHGYAGRYDLRLETQLNAEVTTKHYPKRKDVRGVLPAGRHLVDLKTSKGVYPTHALQLAAYELASVECGYEPTDHRWVLHVFPDGAYELVQTFAPPEGFLSVLSTYRTLQGLK